MGTDLIAVDVRKMEEDERLVRRRFWDKLRANLSRLPFVEDLLAAYYCAADPVTPRAAKAMLLAALAYFILPFDVIPDWLLGLGFTDDAAVLVAALQALRSNIRDEHYERARDTLARERARAGEGGGSGEPAA